MSPHEKERNEMRVDAEFIEKCLYEHISEKYQSIVLEGTEVEVNDKLLVALVVEKILEKRLEKLQLRVVH